MATDRQVIYWITRVAIVCVWGSPGRPRLGAGFARPGLELGVKVVKPLSDNPWRDER